MIVLVCHEGTNTLTGGSVTLSGTTRSTTTVAPPERAHWPKGVTQADLGGLGGAQFGGLGHGTFGRAR